MSHAGFGGCRDSRPQKAPLLLLPGSSEKQLLAEAAGDAIQPTKSEQIAAVGTKSFTPKGV